MESVSVIVCCRNEIAMIDRFLQSLAAQTASGLSIEAVIADGCSSDGTRQRLNEFAAQHSWVRVIDNGQRIASTGLNAALRLSKGMIIARMDAHTEYAPDYLRECVRTLQETGASAVGGPVRIRAESTWQKAFANAVQFRLFNGGSTVYDTRLEGSVDSVPYGCWLREVLEDAGGFDQYMVRNQDDELSFRIKQAGGLIWQSPRICSFYSPRRSPIAFAKQFFGYGFWKVRTMRKHRTVVSARHLAPVGALSLAAALFPFGLFSRSARRLLAAMTAMYCAAILATVRRLQPALLALFPIAHASYGAGTLMAILQAESRP